MRSIQTDTRPQAALVLADGTVFRGRSLGAAGTVTAEVVFNTSMTGYQEILTDPSYTGQIVTLTYPHIGNVGVNPSDEESARVAAAGLIVRCASPVVSNFRATDDLSSYLKKAGTVAVSDIDTRALVRRLRTFGAQAGCLVAAKEGALTDADIEAAKKAAASWGSMVGRDLAAEVSTKTTYEWKEGLWGLKAADGEPGFNKPETFKYKVVAYDFGIKRNILREMAERGMEVTVVPATTPVSEVLAMNPDGVFLSNGPGDPEPCPVVDLKTKRVYITSQNHGFAVDAATLPEGVEASHKSLFDGSLQGLRFVDAPAISFQGHPEASPGPHDIAPLFDRFAELMRSRR